jgi:diguanylate cyclase (GGDEF)-like protein
VILPKLLPKLADLADIVIFFNLIYRKRPKIMLKVKDIEMVVKEPSALLTIREDATAAEAAKKMNDNQVGCLLVLDTNGKFTGILSERDLLSKMLAVSLPAESTLVKNIASTDVITCTRDTKVAKIQQLMTEHQIRHIPIVENNIPVGIISSRDIIAYLVHNNTAMKAAAEQLKILSAKLKGMDLHDLYDMMINEVPGTFEADSAIMCFTQEGSSEVTVYRKGCTVAENELAKPKEIIQLSHSWTICGELCEACEKIGGCAPRIIIPLRIHKQYSGIDDGKVNLHGFLCMCQLNQNSIQTKELQLYKASLLQEMLSLHITSAKLFNNYQNASHESIIDPLTNVGSRSLLEKMLKIEYARGVRYKRSFSVAIIGIDHFKKINVIEGQETGDNIVLQQIGKTISQHTRKVDLVGRYNKNKFVLLLPETKKDGAKILISRLQKLVKNIPVPEIKSVTISGGITEWNGLPEDTIENILERTKTSLLEAHHSGGNCLVTT